LLPYTLLRRGWKRKHRELSMVDLSLGLFIPFIIATSCLVIAAGSAFYTKTDDVLNPDGSVRPEMARAYVASANGFLAARDGAVFTAATPADQATQRDALSPENRRMAATLAHRDA